MHSKNWFFVLLTLFFVICLVLPSLGQPGTGGPCGNPPCGGPNQPVPITGIEYLIAAGAVLGIRQFVNTRKNKS